MGHKISHFIVFHVSIAFRIRANFDNFRDETSIDI